MSGATADARSPDRLDGLGAEDFRRLFAVLDAVVDSAGPEERRDELVEALARHLGWPAPFVVLLTPEGSDVTVREITVRTGDLRTVALVRSWLLNEGTPAAGQAPRSVGAGAPEVVWVEFPADRARALCGTLASIRRPAPVLLGALGRQLAPLFREGPTGRVDRLRWQLTDRELEVAQLAAAGLTNHQIAGRLHIALDTVKKHITKVLAKTGCGSRTELAVVWQHSA